MHYFEDFKIGETFESEVVHVKRDEIVSFAKQYDPQSFHTGEDSIVTPLYNDIIASGWHISSVCMKLMVSSFLKSSSCLCSPGIDNLRWHKPMKPGDRLKAVTRVLDKRLAESSSGTGIVMFKAEMFNQNNELILSMNPTIFFALRESATA